MTRYIFFFFLVLILSYILFFSPLLKIRVIEVPNVSEIREIDLEELKNAFKYGNIFLYTENNIKNDLIAEFPIISNIKISKNIIKRSVNLEIKERERTGIICKAEITEQGDELGNCFYVDKTGVIFEDAPQTSGSLILLIKDFSQRDFNIGDKIFSEKIIDFILIIKERLFDETGIRFLDCSISSFPPKDLKITIPEGWYILFDLERESEIQLLSLKAVLEEKIQSREGLEYIDLRIENRVYYK